MDDGGISCSYNYSNFYDQPTGGASTSATGVSTTPAGQTSNFNTDGDIDLSLFEHGELGDLYFGELQGQGLEQDKEESTVPVGFEQGCVVSSQQEIDTGVCPEEVNEGEREQMDAAGTSKISTGGVNSGSSGASSDGEHVRKNKPREVTWRMGEEPYHQEGGVALWVKWRGRWRACIQCYPSDMSIATTRARPTYSKKTYVVVFFPNSRTYSWVDLGCACHISETPEPLAFGTHKSGRDAVENLDLPKHHMLRVLAASMLDLSDRLPVKAVVKGAQDVDAWKAFANEAVAATEYSDVGKMLVKLYAMVSPACYSQQWVQENFERWKRECERASHAQAVENLNKELVNAILWDEVSNLWDSPEQTAVGVEWKDWKRAVIENRSVYPSFSTTPDAALDSENLKRRMQAKSEVDRALKRSKLEVRRRYPTQLVSAKNDLSGFSERNNQQQQEGQQAVVQAEPAQEVKAAPAASTPPSAPKQDEEDVSGRSSSLVRPASVPKRLLSNYQLCAAFMEDKQRQCTRFPSQGSDYCCKHMAKYEKLGAGPASAPPKSSTGLARTPSDRVCAAITRFGKRCTHKVKANSMYCRKHPSLDIDAEVPAALQIQVKENTDLSSQVKPDTQVESQEVKTPSFDEGVKPDDGGGPPEQTPECADEDPRTYNWPTNGRQIDKLIRTSSSGLRIRCLGTCVTGEQCLHKSKPGSEYCEKHQPDTESAEEEEPVPEVKRKQDPVHAMLKAKSWLSRYMEIAKVDVPGSSDSAEKLLEWVVAEASKDVTAATNLMQMVSERMEKLERFLKLQETSAGASVGDDGTAQEDAARLEDKSSNIDEEKQIENIKCSICDEVFNEMGELGRHWKSSHPTEAHWFMKAYACKDCKKEFTNKSSLERHCKADHPSVTDIPAVTLSVCSNCDEHFADFETLWDHVITGHPDHLSATPAIPLPADEDFQQGEDPSTAVPESEDQVGRADKQASDSADSDDFMDILNPEESYEETKPEDVRENFSEDNEDSDCKFICKVCGKRFLLLPDLGRHHQAAHMSAHIGTISKSRTGGMIPGTSKSRKRVRVSKQGMSSMRRIKRALHSVQQQKSEKSDHELETNPKVPGEPPEDEIFSAASLACCETGLHASLEDKYEIVPVGLLDTVTKLANQQDVRIEWTAEAYVCQRGCGKLPDARLQVYRKSSLPPATGKKSVLCDDISFGKEFIPVPCVEDEELEPCTCSQCREGKALQVDSANPWETFKYVTKRLLDPSLGLDTKDSQIGCGCGRGRCFAKSCLHVEMFDNDYVEACDIWGEEMMGRFPYDADGRIILQEGYLVYECNASCMCSNDCQNRVLQRGVRVKLEVFKTRHKGWAVRAAQHIPRGTFVCEYLGEVLNDQEANRRGERYDKVGCSYLYDIDVHLNSGSGRSRRGPSRAPRVKPFVIDGTKIGNVSRFINHSCSPNLINYQVLVESMDYQLAHIGLFASRDILCGEELAYDYRYKLLPGRGCPCHCGSSGCRGRLY